LYIQTELITSIHLQHAVEKSRKLQNVKPVKPTAEERVKIKEYFIKHRKLPKFPMEEEPS